MDANMQMVAICQEYSWTYQQFSAQPAFFIELIKEKMRIDYKAQELSLKKSHRGN